MNEEFLNMIFSHAPIGIAIVNSKNGVINSANEAYCAMLGRTKEHVEGNFWMQFTHPDDILHDFVCLKNLRKDTSKSGSRSKRYLHSNGSIIYANVTVIPIDNNSRINPLNLTHCVMVQNYTQTELIKTRLKGLVHEVSLSRDAVFNSMALLAQFRDRETGEHILRTKKYVKLLLENFPYQLPYSRRGIHQISQSAMLHDIGKVGIPDSILMKPGALTRDEFNTMETHTSLGARALTDSMRKMQNDTLLMFAPEIAEFHHERWDGIGYPRRLKGDQIPLIARIMSVADVYDALRSVRPYKKPFTHEESAKIIMKDSGTRFDPILVNEFVHLEREFSEISEMEEAEMERNSEEVI